MTVVDLSKDVVLYDRQSFNIIHSGSVTTYKDILDEVLQKSVQQSAILARLGISLRTYLVQMFLSDMLHTDRIRSFVIHRIVDLERLDKSLIPNKSVI